MGRFGLFVFSALACISASGAQACPALEGKTRTDSTFVSIGDPLFGGTWSNARNGSAYYIRALNAPTNISGFYMGTAGTDITTAGSIIKVTLIRPDGTSFIALDLREADVNRGFSGGAKGTRLDSLTINFPPVTTQQVRFDFRGNGWFGFERTFFFAEGCTTESPR